MDFHSTQVFSVKKADNSMTFANGGIIIAGYIIIHSA
jgi:hypothetical protein